MAESATFADRLKKGLARVAAEAPGRWDVEALTTLRLSLERSLARREPAAVFRYQLNGAKPLLFQGNEALPLEPTRLSQLLSSMDVEIQSGESLELDGGLAAWLLRPEINTTDTNLRQAEVTLNGLRSAREKDHAASQSADSMKIRLRGRLNHLVSALQAAQRDTAVVS